MKDNLASGPAFQPEFLAGGGEMGERIRTYDWSATSLGPVDTWPQSLRTCVRIMLTSRQPIWIGWGNELIKLYNDPYKAIVGGKHPWALGSPASVVWNDIWQDIDPMLKTVMEDNEGTYVESQLLIMERYGYPEETYYTFSYTPIPGDDGKPAGMFCANTDDTEKILSERQLRTLSSLGKELSDCKTYDEVIFNSIDTLSQNLFDFPFAIFRRIENGRATLCYSTPLDDNEYVVQKDIDLNSDHDIAKSINEAITTEKMVVFDNLINRVGKLPCGSWHVPPDHAVIMPVHATTAKEPFGVLILGVNPYRKYDDKFISFCQLIADQVSTAVADVHAFEEERKRVEALAEIDKAKTVFFSNISHEFRTPLTLMLGSLEDLLNNQISKLDEESLGSVETTHRNALRLLRLVNNLLDFSRIEAGKIKAHFQLTDISKLTADLASTFRSLCEKAGLTLTVSCNKIDLPVFVDRDMWEKIVLNLLSNAFKFTLKGSITISLTSQQENVVLKVTDTGVGIPQEEIPKMFQRFHRIENSPGRTFEGTGIGLSLVSELVKLHGGEISVASEINKGSEFTIMIASGKAHLPTDQVINDIHAYEENFSNAFIEEAQSLIERSHAGNASGETAQEKTYSVLVVDDNADMRAYFKKLLQDKYHIVTAGNGQEALQKIQSKMPDLVVSDIMMPVMDGIQLVREIKHNPATYHLPIILVSARAGEEAKIEGYDIGADDYLIKPFSAKELQARVRSQLNIKQIRENALNNLYRVFDDMPFAVAALKGEDLLVEFINKYNLNIWQAKKEDVMGKPLFEVYPGEWSTVADIHKQIYQTGNRFSSNEVALELFREGAKEIRYFNTIVDPMLNEQGQIVGQIAASIDITEQVRARKQIEASEAQFRNILEQAPDPILILKGENMVLEVANEPLFQIWNVGREAIGKPFLEILPEMNGQGFFEMLQDVYFNNKIIKGEESPATFYEKDGNQRKVYFNFTYQPYRDHDGSISGVLVLATDVTQQVLSRKKTEESENRFRTLTQSLPQLIWTADTNGYCDFFNQQWYDYTGSTPEDSYGNGWTRYIHSAHIQEVYAKWQHSLKTGEPVIAEFQARAANGSYQWFYVVGNPLKSQDGTILKWIGTLTNIDERRKWEEALRLSEKRYSSLTEATTSVVWTADRTGQYVRPQQSWEAYTGQPWEEHQGWGWTSMLHPEDRERAVNSWKLSLKEKTLHEAEARIWSNQYKEYRYGVAKAVPLLNESGEVEEWIGMISDVHQQKIADVIVREAEERYSTTVNASQLGLWDFDVVNQKVVASGKMADIYGLSSNEEYSIDIARNSVHPDDADEQNILFTSIVDGKVSQAFSTEYRIIQKNTGNTRWIRANAKVFFNEEGTLYRTVGTVTDITKNKRSDSILSGQKKALEQAVDGQPIAAVLETIVETAETQSSEKLFASILLIDNEERCVWHGAAPSLPEAYNLAINGAAIGPAAGSCGTAAYTGRDVVVADIEHDPLWKDYKDLALGYGLKACWSTPIISSKGKSIGTFALYYPIIKEPSAEDREVIALLAKTAGIVIEWYKDIEIRQQAEQSLRASEVRFRNLVEEATVATAVFEGADMVLALANDAMLQILGRDNAVLGMKLLEFLPELRDQEFPGLLQEVYQTGRTYSAEEALVVLNRGGILEDVYLDYSFKALRDASGNIYGILVSAVDLTERFTARRELAISEQRFQNLVRDTTAAIIVLTGEEMKVEIVNEAYSRLIGRRPDELIGKPLFTIIPETEPYYLPILSKVRQTGEPIYLSDSPYSVSVDNTIIEGFLHVVYQPYKDSEGNILGVMAILQDVTDSVKSRKALEESEERFRTLATAIPQIVWTTDKNGNVDYISPQWEEYTGQPVKEALTENNLMVHPDDMQLLAARWMNGLENKTPWRQEYRLRDAATGEYRWFAGVIEPLKGKDNEILKWIGTASDIHEQKQFAEELEKLVKERTKELERSNQDLQQFAHVASHDLKEPVRKIKTFILRLEDEYSNALPEKGQNFIRKVDHAANRMLAMIEGVLSYSKVSSQQVTVESVDLNEIIQQVETDLEIPIQQKKASIIRNELMTVEGASLLIYQLFYNLINNSLKFSKEGNPPVIEIASQPILDNGNEYAKITVTDNGIGFNPEDADKLFKTFSRLYSKDKYEGTGLGLSLCQKIVERHNGYIVGTGTLGIGAEFTILLPIKQINAHL